MKRDQLKSLLLGAILLAGITLPAKAQIGEQRHNFAIGINGGANYSTVSFQPTIKQNGEFAKIFEKWFGRQPEAELLSD